MSGLAEVTSPPYDVIYNDAESQLIAADPHNVVRLILPRPVPSHPGEEYQEAAESLREWQDQRILLTDESAALYVYEQSSAGEAGAASGTNSHGELLQRGLIGAVRLLPPEAGVILPHEDVSPGPVAGRLALMEATQANLEPIFLLYDSTGEHQLATGAARPLRPAASVPAAATKAPDGDAAGTASVAGAAGATGAAARIIAEHAAREPLISAVTPDGLRHNVWAITDPGELAAIAADLAPRQALIADGHHRYAAYRKLQARRYSAGLGSGPWDYGLALLVDSASYPPKIGAIHRVIPGLDVQQAAKLAASAFAVRALPGGSADLAAATAALDESASSGELAFVLAGDGHAYLISHPDPEQAQAAMPPGTSEQWRALPAAILQELLITRVWGLTDDDNSVRVVHHDAEAALRVAREASGTTVLCSPMSAADVYGVAARGEKVPRKSTSFAPKPRTGLVMRSFAQG